MSCDVVAPPQSWMPAVWDHDSEGLPVRHRPGRPFADLWESRCDRAVFLFDFAAMRAVMELRPCLACQGLSPEGTPNPKTEV